MSNPKTISSEVLCALTGLTADKISSIARKGFFPTAKKSEYLMADSIRGLFRYFQAPGSGSDKISFPVVEGISATANRIGAPEALLKSVKKAGSKAFLTGNRVDTGILLPELFAALSKGSQLPDGIATPQDWLATEKAKREAIKRQTDEKELMPCASCLKQMAEAGGYAFAELERMARELPPALAGQDAVSIGKRISAEVERIRKTLKEKCEKIEE